MDTIPNTIAEQIAEAAGRFQPACTGHTPQSVTVVFGRDTLVITLHGALSPAEKVLAQSAGAAQVRSFTAGFSPVPPPPSITRSSASAGREVREAAAEVEPATGTVVHAFTTGAMVQVFNFAEHRPVDATADHSFITLPERTSP